MEILNNSNYDNFHGGGDFLHAYVTIHKYFRPSTTTKLTTLTIFFHIRVVTTSKLTIFFILEL
jgi:hypothetical protein